MKKNIQKNPLYAETSPYSLEKKHIMQYVIMLPGINMAIKSYRDNLE